MGGGGLAAAGRASWGAKGSSEGRRDVLYRTCLAHPARTGGPLWPAEGAIWTARRPLIWAGGDGNSTRPLALRCRQSPRLSAAGHAQSVQWARHCLRRALLLPVALLCTAAGCHNDTHARRTHHTLSPFLALPPAAALAAQLINFPQIVSRHRSVGAAATAVKRGGGRSIGGALAHVGSASGPLQWRHRW